MSYTPHTEQDKKEMMQKIGVTSIEELFKDVPEQLLLKKQLNLPKPLSEQELLEHMQELSKKNKNYTLFLGAGSYDHYIPAAVENMMQRSEFLTAYTPYQPEISQGILQAMYEYQTMICNLTGLDVSNASLYDGATATVEAALMACRIKRKNEILASKALHPEYRQALKSYLKRNNLALKEIELDNGETSKEDLEKKISQNTAGVLIQHPNFFGILEDMEELSRVIKGKDLMYVTTVTEAVSLGLLKEPGYYKADIAAGEGQSFGNPMSFGGPTLGFLACKKEHMRQMPGRIIGATVDEEGKTAYCLTLATREQHIRREKATSNICSNQALNALTAAAYLSLTGKKGLKKVAEQNYQKAHDVFEKLTGLKCFEPLFPGKEFFNEFAIKSTKKSIKEVNEALLKKRIIGGLEIGKYYPEYQDSMLLCITEKRTPKEMSRLVRSMQPCDKNCLGGGMK